MKANEFIAEAGWFDKTSRAAVAKKHAAAQKANVPKISKAITNLLSLKVNDMLGRADAIGQKVAPGDIAGVVSAVMHKSLQVDPKHDVFNNIINPLIGAVVKDPEGIKSNPAIGDLVKQMVAGSFAIGASELDKGMQTIHAEVLIPVDAEGQPDNSTVYVNDKGEWSKWSKSAGGGYERVQTLSPDAGDKIDHYQQTKKISLVPASLKPTGPGTNIYKFTKSKGL